MRWANAERLNPHKIIHKYHLLDRTLNRNRAKIDAAGTPATTFRNVSLDPNGRFKDNLTKCYCWDNENNQQSQPDRRHELCLGTGYLEGYSKYGYEETTIGTPSNVILSSNVSDTAGDNGRISTFVINDPSREGTIETERIELIRFLEIDRFLSRQLQNLEDNRVEYYYNISEPFDDSEVNWVQINMVDYSVNTNFATHTSDGFTIPEDTEYIKFKIKLLKKYTTSQSARFNHIRFRYKNQKDFSEIDPRFSNINIPAFLAAREQVKEKVIQGQDGWTTIRPMRWWSLPEANIEESDAIQFLDGTMSGDYHLVQETTKYQYGKKLQILHRDYETRFIRDSDDLYGIIHLLT